MKHEPLPPIPTPLSLRWREFRVRVLPLLLFAGAVGSACFIWRENVGAPMLVGAVEARSAQVITPYAGRIVKLNVSRFQTVIKGEPVALLTPTDPRAVLAVVQSELDIIQARLGPSQTERRVQTDYQQLRTEWLVQRVALATAQVKLQGARDELYRQKALHEKKLVADDIYELAVTSEAALASEVLERSNVVRDAEAGLKQLDAIGLFNQTNNFITSLSAVLDVQEQKLKQASVVADPVILYAPIDGVISQIYRQAGENISDGVSVLLIEAAKPERIVAYLRQPVSFEPKVGTAVEVRTRSLKRQIGRSQINHIGAQFEPITNVLAMMRPGSVTDYGLPIEISLPPGLNVLPGEIVDVSIVAVD